MLDLGGALLQKDYNQELRDATAHYGSKGKLQGLLGTLGGYGGQALATAILSGGLSVPAMAIAGGLANAAGTYVGGKMAGLGYDDYDGKFGQETISELSDALDTSLLTSAATGALTGGKASYEAGLGAGTDAVGKVTDEAVDAHLDKLAIENVPGVESVFGGDPDDWIDPTYFQTDTAGVRSLVEDEDLLKALREGKVDTIDPKYTGYSFTADIDGTGYDYDWHRQLLDARADDKAFGTTNVQDMLSAVDSESREAWIAGMRDSLEPGIREQAALRGMDAEGNFLVDDPADLGPETFGKKLQDWSVLGWDESGGTGGLFDNFGFHFEKQPDVIGFDPVTQTFTSTPAPNQNMNPWQWAKDNPWMAGIGGAGLLMTLLSEMQD
jgi:hypothetical protein